MLFAVIALVVVVVLDVIMAALLPPLSTLRLPTATVGPSPTPRPTNTPVPTPTEVPCDGPQWWESVGATVAPFFQSNLLTGGARSVTNFDEFRSAQQGIRDAAAALPYPPCLAGAHDDLLDTLNALLLALNVPNAQQIVAAASLYGLPYDNVRHYYAAISDGYENLRDLIAGLEAQGVTPQDSDLGGSIGAARQFARFNTLDCQATRWAATEAVSWFALVSTAGDSLTSGEVDRNQLGRVVIQLQNNGLRIEGAPFPNCMAPARADLLEANDGLVAAIQGLLSGDSAALQQNAAAYAQARGRLEAAIRSYIAFMNIPS
ncbi:MAG: hypothetical protein HXY40_08155 [Chloroflexi bacterium]|nr:hypothetical protein [Chloroflexota bacterium]